jgi:phosphate transport system substrate-binding protein
MLRAKRTIVIISLALAGCRGPIHVPTATPETVSVRILATTATYPLLQDLAAGYIRPDLLLAVSSAAVNWETIYNELRAGETPYALTTYAPLSAGLWRAPIGQDGIAIIVHATNPISELTLEELALIFEGRIRTWAEVGGADFPVTIVSRETGDDTRLALETLVPGSHRVPPSARLVLSSQSMIDVVGKLPGAVGYVSMAQVTGPVRAVPIHASDTATAYPPTPATVNAGNYPLRTPILIVGLEPPAADSIYYQWFAWMQSAEGQAIVGRAYGMLEF